MVAAIADDYNILCSPMWQETFHFSFGFWPQGMWDPSSLPEIEPTPSVLEGEVSTTGLPGNSPVIQFDSQTSVAQENMAATLWGRHKSLSCCSLPLVGPE